MCRFEYLYYQCCPREPQFPCITKKYEPFKILCQASLDNIYMEPHVPGPLEDTPWIPLPGPCGCDGRWTDGRSYAYGPNGDGSIEGPDMAVLLEVIREGKVSAARRQYFPDCQTPAPPAVRSNVLPDQQAQLLGTVPQEPRGQVLGGMLRRDPGGNLVNPGVAALQMPIQQQPYAPGSVQQYLPGLDQSNRGVVASSYQQGQIPIEGQGRQGQGPVPWPSTLVGQIMRPYNYRQGPSYSSTGEAGNPMPTSLPQRTVTTNDAMAWYNSNIFPRIDAPAASSRPRQEKLPARQPLPPVRQQRPSMRQQPPPSREQPRLRSSFPVAGPSVPLAQQQPHPQPLGYDPFPAQNYFDLINQTEQRNMRPSMPSVPASGPPAPTPTPSTSRLDPMASTFAPSSQSEASTTSAVTAPEQPAASGDWTRNLGHYVQPQFRNQGTGTPYIQPQWKRQPGAWTRGE